MTTTPLRQLLHWDNHSTEATIPLRQLLHWDNYYSETTTPLKQLLHWNNYSSKTTTPLRLLLHKDNYFTKTTTAIRQLLLQFHPVTDNMKDVACSLHPWNLHDPVNQGVFPSHSFSVSWRYWLPDPCPCTNIQYRLYSSFQTLFYK